jgi:hypothetical protein
MNADLVKEICPYCRHTNTLPSALLVGVSVACAACKQNFTYSGGKLHPSVPDLLRAAAETYEQRNALYGDSYKNFGKVMDALFPNGLELSTVDDWNRMGVFNMIVSKVTRYAANLSTGGHSDSAHDLSVYASMLEELTQEKNHE